MKLCVIRHGQTDLNLQCRMQARKGLPLNANGIAQVQAAAEELKGVVFDYVFSSPQVRAVETARILCGYAQVQPIERINDVVAGDCIYTDERINAFDVGTADGLIIDADMKLLYGLVPDSNVYEGVEDVQAFKRRVFDFLDELQTQFRGLNVTILIAGHKCTTGCIRGYFEGFPENGDFFSLSSKNGKYRLYEIE